MIKLPPAIKINFFGLLLVLAGILTSCNDSQDPLSWPEITQEAKPWSRWWWMGSAVNEKDLAVALEQYKNAGLGGLEITPIYGVRGSEDQFISYLSPEWMNMLVFTLEKADSLGLGIDMATGSGWPFGGPWVSPSTSSKYITSRKYSLTEGESLQSKIEFIQKPLLRTVAGTIDISAVSEPISANKDLQSLAIDQVRFEKPLPLLALMAYSDRGEILNLSSRVDNDGVLSWEAPAGNWTLYALFQGWHGKMVERAAPGGEGLVIDHFSQAAVESYLANFDSAFSGYDISGLRSFFNDSYEVDDAAGEANWTPEFLNEFKNRNGYELEKHLPALFQADSGDMNVRVLTDYRATISDLLLERFTLNWRDWAVNHNHIIRNQSHGSPGNLLDLYAASDIPETEGTDIFKMKFASSAAHVTGKKLVSSESGTWMNEHFLGTLAQLKGVIDEFILGGVNHIFYHGTTYSPENEKWPGWMFYASCNLSPSNSLWTDFAKINDYVARCQSFMQEGKPDNDVLLYFPFYDRISIPGRAMLEHFSGSGSRFSSSDFQEIAKYLYVQGFSFDYISDSQIMNLEFAGQEIHSPGATYKTIIVPECRYMPVQTLRKLEQLAENGANILFHGDLPGDFPGLANFDENLTEFNALKEKIIFTRDDHKPLSIARTGSGSFLSGEKMEDMLSAVNITREPMVDSSLNFVRRKYENGFYYFIVNQGKSEINAWIPLQAEAKSAAIFSPMKVESGMAKTRNAGKNQVEVYLELNPGESLILKTFENSVDGKSYSYFGPDGEAIEIQGKWMLSFTAGGPAIPGIFTLEKPRLWTACDIQRVNEFSGTAKYEISFPRPGLNAVSWRIDLGKVCESARMVLNGKELGTIVSEPYRLEFSNELFKDINTLEVYVSNLMANRIAEMDKNKMPWKKFYNVNFPARRPENRGEDGLFNASGWPVLDSGLEGPVKLIPLKIKDIKP